MYFTSDPPANMRIHLLNVERRDAIRFKIYYGPRQRMDVYNREGQYITPLNGRTSESGNLLYVRPPSGDPEYFHNIYRMCPERHGMLGLLNDTHFRTSDFIRLFPILLISMLRFKLQILLFLKFKNQFLNHKRKTTMFDRGRVILSKPAISGELYMYVCIKLSLDYCRNACL